MVWERPPYLSDTDPHSLYYCNEHGALLLADGRLSRILVLDPRTGRTLQRINLFLKGIITALDFSGDQLVVRAGSQVTMQLSATHTP